MRRRLLGWLALFVGLIPVALFPTAVAAVAPPPVANRTTGQDPTKRLPTRVDNSTLQFFPPILQQRGGSCAQVTAIQNVFAYELNLQRGLSSQVETNQYPAHFTWLCLNNAQGKGSNAQGGWVIAREMGIPNVETYGTRYGLYANSGWMSGYDKYFQAMHNRVESFGSLSMRTRADLEKIKGFLHNRNDAQSETGGLLYFSLKSKGRKGTKVAKGEHEEGKALFTSWGNDGPHAMTLVGYDDNVGHDVNGDGKITNDIDITGDKKVDLADMERGAFLFADSKGTRFGNGGKAYVMYRVWALKDGGAGTRMSWVKPRKDHQPTMTLKLKFDFSDRSALRLSTGVASDATATKATKEIRPALFNGKMRVGEVPMRGKDDKEPIEIGLDLTHLREGLKEGKEGKFFLDLDRKTGSEAKGKLLEASVRFYENGKLVRELPFAVKEGEFGDKPMRLSVTTKREEVRVRD